MINTCTCMKSQGQTYRSTSSIKSGISFLIAMETWGGSIASFSGSGAGRFGAKSRPGGGLGANRRPGGGAEIFLGGGFDTRRGGGGGGSGTL